MGRFFSAYGAPLTAFYLFRYPGQTLLSSDKKWLAVERNLRRERGKWGRLAKILGREVIDNRLAGRFYVAVVQAVLLFGSKTWVLNSRLDNSFEGIHHWAVLQMAGMGLKRLQYGTYVHPHIGSVLAMVGLEEIRVYIARRQNTVTQYTTTCPTMELCLAVERKPGMCLSR